MIRNKKVEVVVLICSILFVVSYLMYTFIDGAYNTKFNNFKRDAMSFCYTVMNNNNIFNEKNTVFLEEVIDEGLMTNIKSPFSSNLCDSTQSKVEKIDSRWFVTLKCDDYLLDNLDMSYGDNQVVYRVSDWEKETNEKSSEEKILYNCIDKTTKNSILEKYVDEDYLLYRVNKRYNKEFLNINDISKNYCSVVSNNFTRSKSEIEIENRSS